MAEQTIERTYQKLGSDLIPWTRSQVEAGVAAYPTEERALYMWLHGYAMTVLAGRKSLLLEALDVSETTLSRVWRGKYEAGRESFLATVRRLKADADVAQGTEWIETCVTRAIHDVCDYVHRRRCMGVICGDSGRGKTHAVQQWQMLNNHGMSLYVYAPDSNGRRPLLMAIAKACGIRDTSRTTEHLIARIHGEIGPRNTLILDEAQRLLPPGSRSTGAMESLRTLHDLCGVAVVLVVTPQFEADRQHGPMQRYLAQMNRRIKDEVQIPERMSTQEATEICQAFSGDPEPKLIQVARKIANEPFSGSTAHLIELLRDARGLAQDQERKDVSALDLATALKAERDRKQNRIPID